MRCYFHLVNGHEFIPDDIGIKASDLATAQDMALQAIEDIQEEAIQQGASERPGALLKFLNGLSGSWNISLFHYRNHGADYGRVLAGIQVPAADRAQLKRSLDDLGYPYWDESDNPAYRSFLNRDAMSVSTIL